ncbi:MAG: hypothetical protein MZU79_01320 [Anaerotruncus sp.]|nr:hypothetical protein [Anaerotruncus sp.]
MTEKPAALALGRDIPAQLSLEAMMGCGFGGLLGLRPPHPRDGEGRWRKICEDGPVFRGRRDSSGRRGDDGRSPASTSVSSSSGNPVLTASGTFGYGTEFIPYLDLSALGGIVVKGLYYGPREGNPPPRSGRDGLGPDQRHRPPGRGRRALRRRRPARTAPEHDTAVIVNVCGASDDEYFRVIEFLDRQ